MQLLGIYIKGGDPKVLKNLVPGWYPLETYTREEKDIDFSKLINDETDIELINYYKDILLDRKVFLNNLYKQDNNTENYSISINSIVGQNGSGKSTLISIYYRIINNLACKIKECLPDCNLDYTPIWASGINATLYYENTPNDMDSEISICKIEVSDNE